MALTALAGTAKALALWHDGNPGRNAPLRPQTLPRLASVLRIDPKFSQPWLTEGDRDSVLVAS